MAETRNYLSEDEMLSLHMAIVAHKPAIEEQEHDLKSALAYLREHAGIKFDVTPKQLTRFIDRAGVVLTHGKKHREVNISKIKEAVSHNDQAISQAIRRIDILEKQLANMANDLGMSFLMLSSDE